MANLSRKQFLKMGGLSVLSAILAGCGSQDKPADSAPASTPASEAAGYSFDGNDFVMKLRKSEDLYRACDQQGTVTPITYDTRAYALEKLLGEGELPMQKTAYVYTPYGYDPAKQYNELYLMHGGGESEIYWLSDDGTPHTKGKSTCALIDNMVKAGTCAETIVISTTYNATPAGYEERAAELFEGNGAPDDSGDNDNQPNIVLTEEFYQELRNDLIPAVVSAYSTYAAGDGSIESIIASRGHRGFAGFSMGSCTTFRAGICHSTDIIAYFGNYSGSLTSPSKIEDALNGEFADYEIKYWYNGNGTDDMAHDEHHDTWKTVVADMPDRFVDGESTCFVDFDGGTHSYNCWVVHLYNSLLVFFKK